MAMPTLANLKSYMGVAGSSDDTMLTFAINAGNQWFLSHTGRVFVDPGADADVEFPVVYPFVRGRKLWLDDQDLYSLTSITNGDGAAIPASAVQKYPINAPYDVLELLPSVGYSWGDGGNGTPITVTGRWCYSTDIPADANTAILMLAQYLYLVSLTGPASISASRAGDFQIDTNKIPTYVLEVAERYRRW